MSKATPRSHRVALGHTLLEMLLSLVLLSIVMASVGSAVMFASQAVPDDSSPAGSLLVDGAALSRVAEDLSAAQYIIEQTAEAVTVVVPDRTGDGIPDRIRYAWSGVEGEPLTYQFNDDAAVTLINAMVVFDLSYNTASATEALPPAIYLGSETQVAAFDSDTNGGLVLIEATQWSGQKITPALSVGSMGFVPTRAEMHAGWRNPEDGKTLISIRDLTGSTPGNNSYASGIFDEASLSGSNSWESMAFVGGSTVPADQSIAMTAAFDSGTTVALELSLSGDSAGLLTTVDGGGTWSEVSGKTLAYRLYGRELLTRESSYQVTCEHMTMIQVSLQSVAEGRAPLTRMVRMMQAPPLLTSFAQSDFSADPVGMDLNADGAADWTHSVGSMSAGSLNDGVWTCDGELAYALKEPGSSEVIRVRARMRSNDTLGPTIHGPYTLNADDELLPVMTQLRDDGAGGQELVLYNSTKPDSERLVLSGLPSGLIDLELILIPDQDLVTVKVANQPVVSLTLERIANPGTVEPSVRFASAGGVAEFGSVDVAVGGSESEVSDGGLLEFNVSGLGINLY